MALKLLLNFELKEIKRVLAQKSKSGKSPKEFMTHSPIRPLISTFALATIALASPLLSTSAHAALILTNGNFEDGLDFISPVGGTDNTGNPTAQYDGNLNGWVTGGTGLNALATNSESYFGTGPGRGPHGGTLAAVFPNTPTFDGYISQIAATTANTWYTVGFWLSAQGDAYDGPYNNLMSVYLGGTIPTPGGPLSGASLVSGINPTLPGAIPVPTGWTHYQFNFLATSASTRLSFLGGGSPETIALDDVEMIEIVPEVSSFGMLTGLGLLAFGTAARFRRRSLVTA